MSEINSIFKDAIGQESVKKTLSIYIDAYKKKSEFQVIVASILGIFQISTEA